MREGPLAALFRKTEAGEDEATESAAAEAEAAQAAAERELPHPGLSAPPQGAEPDAPHVPTPRERLRHAFSSEIPENVMDRHTLANVMDDYPREHSLERAGAKVNGQPVLRVVGVGGAGVNAVNRMVEAEVE